MQTPQTRIQFIHTGVFPGKFKTVLVSPVYRAGASEDLIQYWDYFHSYFMLITCQTP